MSYEKPLGPHLQGVGQFPMSQVEYDELVRTGKIKSIDYDKVRAEVKRMVTPDKPKKKPFRWVFNGQAQ